MLFEFESISGRPCREFICEVESFPLLASAAVQADGQTAHWLHGENDSCECLHVCFPQSERQPSLTHLPSPLTLCGCPKGRA
jgi:hypothetical protein